MKTQGDIQHELNQRIKQLEAQLAELRGARCETCEHARVYKEGNCYCIKYGFFTPIIASQFGCIYHPKFKT